MRRTFRLLVAAATVLSLAVSPAAAEDFADDCYDGPASEASAESPHIWDFADDTHEAAIHKEGMDLRAGWIGINEETGGFTANIQVTEMPVHPFQARYNFSYQGPLGEHFVTASATETLGWRFTYGHLEPNPDTGVNSQVTDGETTGEVDTDAAIISIDLPEEAVPAPSDDGSEVVMPLIGMTSHQSIGTTVTGGLLLRTDEANIVCTAVLHEAEDAE